MRIPEKTFDSGNGIVNKDPEQDAFEGSIDTAFEDIISKEGSALEEVSFEQSWRLTRSDVLQEIQDYRFRVSLPKMLELEQSAYEEGSDIPKDFKQYMNRAYRLAILETLESIAHGDHEHAGNMLDVLEFYALNSRILDKTLLVSVMEFYDGSLIGGVEKDLSQYDNSQEREDIPKDYQVQGQSDDNRPVIIIRRQLEFDFE